MLKTHHPISLKCWQIQFSKRVTPANLKINDCNALNTWQGIQQNHAEKIREKTEMFTSNSQFGFRRGRCTVDAIFIVRQIMEKAKGKDVKLHFNFVDFKSAFDTIWRKSL